MRPILKTIALLTINSLLTFHAHSAEAKKPNILLIVADDLGYGELGAQGFTKDIPTPYIDSIAAHGTRFTSGYVSGPYCSPTRAGLLTGRYQQRFGHEFNPGPAPSPEVKFGLSLNEKTIGDRLKPAGYANGWFGKSHLGNLPEFHPLKRGFDEYFGFLGGAHSCLENGGGAKNSLLRGTEPATEKIDYTTDAFAREAAGFIYKNREKPWFVYLPFNAVHGPLQATPQYLERFMDIQNPKRRTFAAMLSAMDDGVGTVLTKIRDLKQEENTLVFFISDNGGPTQSITSGNGPLRGFKAQTWEGGVRVPFFVQWKGHLPEGKVDDRPVIQLDILPTVLAATETPLPADAKPLDGVNLLPYIKGENKEQPHEALYWRFGQQIAIRKGDWKLVKAPGIAGIGGKKGAAVSAAASPEVGPGKADKATRKKRKAERGAKKAGEPTATPTANVAAASEPKADATPAAAKPDETDAGETPGLANVSGAQLFNLKDDIGEQTNLADKEPEKLKELAAQWQKWNSELAEPAWLPNGKKLGKAAGKGKRRQAAAAAEASASADKPAAAVSAQGPWKSGDSLSEEQSPQIAGKALEISAENEAAGENGVIVAQGGLGNGFALYLAGGKPTLAVRAKKRLTTATTTDKLPASKHTIGAKLAADGKVTFTIDGKEAGEGKVSGPVPAQPKESLTIGNDGQAPVGEYEAPAKLPGKIENVTVKPL